MLCDMDARCRAEGHSNGELLRCALRHLRGGAAATQRLHAVAAALAAAEAQYCSALEGAAAAGAASDAAACAAVGAAASGAGAPAAAVSSISSFPSDSQAQSSAAETAHPTAAAVAGGAEPLAQRLAALTAGLLPQHLCLQEAYQSVATRAASTAGEYADALRWLGDQSGALLAAVDGARQGLLQVRCCNILVYTRLLFAAY